MNFTINVFPLRITKCLALFAIGLLIASVISHSVEYDLKLTSDVHRWFNADGEKNFPSAFSSGLLLFSSLLTAIITAYKSRVKDKFVVYWAGLCGLFGLLAADEWLSFHEQLSASVHSVLPVSGLFHFAWVIAGLAFSAAFGLTYVRFIGHLPAAYRRGFLIAAATFIAGAIGMEMLSGYYADTHQQWNRNIWLGLTTVEEGLEMLGVILCIKSLLTYIRELVGDIDIHLRSSGQPQQISNPTAPATFD